MALDPGISATQPAAASAATGRYGTGARSGSGDMRLDATGANPFPGLAEQLRMAINPDANQSFLQQWLRGTASPVAVTPRVSLAAASFPALGSIEAEADTAPKKLTQTDLQTAVGTYEYNMRVTSGSQRDQGSVINRFF